MNYDLNGEIYLNLNIKDLESACRVDQESIQVCSNKNFWKAYFLKHQLPLPNNVDYYADWIEEFHIAQEVEKRMTMLENSPKERFIFSNHQDYVDYENTYIKPNSYVLNNNMVVDELFINDERIDNLLIKIIDKANHYGLDLTHIEVIIKFEKHWILIYEIYDNMGKTIYITKINITKNQARLYLENVVYLDLDNSSLKW